LPQNSTHFKESGCVHRFKKQAAFSGGSVVAKATKCSFMLTQSLTVLQ